MVTISALYRYLKRILKRTNTNTIIKGFDKSILDIIREKPYHIYAWLGLMRFLSFSKDLP